MTTTRLPKQWPSVCEPRMSAPTPRRHPPASDRELNLPPSGIRQTLSHQGESDDSSRAAESRPEKPPRIHATKKDAQAGAWRCGTLLKRGGCKFMSKQQNIGWRLWTKIRLVPAAVTAFASLLSPEAPAQWLNYPTPGTPRAPDGKPNLAAPTPRASDGKPDLSGVWRGPGGGSYDRNIASVPSHLRLYKKVNP
jgi:hypothetical protein